MSHLYFTRNRSTHLKGNVILIIFHVRHILAIVLEIIFTRDPTYDDTYFIGCIVVSSRFYWFRSCKEKDRSIQQGHKILIQSCWMGQVTSVC